MITWGNNKVYIIPNSCPSRIREGYKTNCDRCNLIDYYIGFQYINHQALCWICIIRRNKYDNVMEQLLDSFLDI